MTLSTGARLGPYEIVAPVGAGGMGEVYRARDTRLDRTVAVKVLPQEFAKNAQLRLRFEREAKTISSLTHPHICTLHDVGEADGVDYLVMEYLEGETLAERISHGPVPVADALAIAIQVTAALEKAHKHGIVHRDLKPSNIVLTSTGAKLLDFGLAKLASSNVVFDGATAHKSLTQEGTIVGTFQYMAPEQLEGREADARTDIFALGAVLYEMLTGRKAFDGKSKVSLIAAILEHEPPPITSIQPLSPPALDRLIATCLAKDPDDRWQTAHDVLLQLRWISEGGSLAGVPAPVAVRRRHREFVWTAATALAMVAAIAFGALWYRAVTRPAEVITTSILPPDKTEFDFDSAAMALSADGRRIAFVATDAAGKRTIWVRPLASMAAQSLAGTEDPSYPFWSPDGHYIGFFSGGKLKKIDISGGPPQALADAPTPRGGTWSADGVILFAATSSDVLYRVSAAGGVAVPVTHLGNMEGSHRWPSFLPDGKHYIYFSIAGFTTNGGDVYAGSLEGGAPVKLVSSVSSPIYSDGYLLYRNDRSLVARAFDAKHLRFTGDVFPVAEDVRMTSQTLCGIYSASATGAIAYQQGGALGQSQLMWVDRTGKVLGNVAGLGDYRHPALSHDGKKLAVQLVEPNASNGDIWIIDLIRGTSTRLTFDPANEFLPLWTPDDKYIIFTSTRNDAGDIYRKLASGLGNDEPLILRPGFTAATDISADGRYILYGNIDPASKRGWDLWIYSTAEKKSTPYLQTQFSEWNARFSPNGKFVAYQSDESGRNQVYVQSFPASGGKWQVSTDGGTRPRWTAKGDELFYEGATNKLMAVKVNTEGLFEAGIPQPLFDTRPKSGPDMRYVPAADGQRFLINQAVKDESKSPITLVQNWAAAHRSH